MTEVLNILCLEDSPQDAEIIHELLTDAGYHLNMDCTAVEKEFVSFLRSNRYDIILADFKLPGFDGFTALRWSVEICPDVPFICISGIIGEETAVELLKMGAVDYILKDRLIRLPSAVQRALEQHRIQIEKRAAELLLKENEEKLQSIFSAAPVGIGLVVGRVFIEVNDTFCKMTGYTRTELTGKNVEVIYAKDEQNESAAIVIYRHIADKGTGSVETRFKCKDGRVLNIFLSSTPLDKDDLTKGVTFIAMDITGKKQAETALRVSEEKYRRIFENVHDVFYETSMDGTIIEVSPSIKILSKGQYSRHELIGKPMNDFYADPKQRIALVHILREHGFVSDYEITLKNRDGTKIPCSISAKIIFDSADRPERINGTMRDITDRKLAEENLKNSEERFKILFEYAPDAYYLNDLKGNLIDGNIAAEKLLGIERKELIGKSFLNLKLLSANQIPKAAALLLKNVLGQSTGPDEFVLHRRDGSKVTVEIITHPVKIQGKLLVLGIARDITERKRAEEAVHVKDWVIKSAINAIVTSDMEGKLNYVNPAFLKLWGYNSPEEVLGKPAVGFWQMGEKAAEVVEAVHTKGGWIGELVARKKDGDFFDVQVAASIVMNDTGQPVCLHASFADITERKKIELKLAQKNNALSKLNRFALELSNLSSDSNLQALIADQVKDISCADVTVFSEYDSSTRTTTPKHIAMDSGLLEKVVGLLGKQIQDIHSVVSDEMYREMTTEMIGIKKTLYEASFGAIPRSVGAAIQGLLKVDRIIGIAYLIEGKLFGTSILLMGKSQPDPPREILENFVHLAAASLRRKQAEDVLRESEEKFRSIMENSADAIFIADQQGKYLYTNKAVTVMLGFTPEEMQNKTIIDLSPPDKTDEYFEMFKKIMNEGKAFAEIELLQKDGNFISTDLNSVLLPGGLVYGSCRDITERKHAKEELIKAKDKAEESDRLKSAFLTNMSHEIRTPMNGIIGFTELLKEPNLSSDDQQDYIQTIQISGARMLNTINSIVDISKIESGLMKVDIQETNLNEKIIFTYKFFNQEVKIKGLKFLVKTGLTAKEAIIKTDNEKVYGILTNLVRNAIKFTYEGSIEFGYVLKSDSEPGSTEQSRSAELEFFVKDTGVGIPQNQKELIFERFRQGSESNNRGYEGSGLGLSICKSYVEMLGGRIWVDSEEGKGSTFYFTLPYNPVSEETSTIENVVYTATKEVQIKKLKILIVEDDEISYSLLTRMLQNISTEVLHAITGVEAVAFCRNNSDLDLVLMDIRMPKMNGLEAIQQIRQFNKGVIIIAQTAYGFSGDREMAIEAGCNDYISKPINQTLLKEIIKSHCNK